MNSKGMLVDGAVQILRRSAWQEQDQGQYQKIWVQRVTAASNSWRNTGDTSLISNRSSIYLWICQFCKLCSAKKCACSVIKTEDMYLFISDVTAIYRIESTPLRFCEENVVSIFRYSACLSVFMTDSGKLRRVTGHPSWFFEYRRDS